MKAVVMAGGEGSRLRPLTSSRPKPLVPVANKPVMHHIVDLLRRHGINEVVATLHYLADEIENYFGDGSEAGRGDGVRRRGHADGHRRRGEAGREIASAASGSSSFPAMR